jgi:hypothetical protein
MSLGKRKRLETDAPQDELHQSVSTTSRSTSQVGSMSIGPLERQPCPKGSVSLHQLCDSCSRFFASWKYLDWYQESRILSERIPSALRGRHVLCTVAHILQSQEDCNSCNMVVSLLPDIESCHPVDSVCLHIDKSFHSTVAICCGGKTDTEVKLFMDSFKGNLYLHELSAPR